MAEETGKGLDRRNRLLDIESQAQKWWSDGKVFEADSNETPPKPGEKFFGNFPFPYMNGYLHLGHAFSLSKLEFAAAYHRLRGANVLFPFSFHCTGMPIKASADKLAREIAMFGNPPVFSSDVKPEGETSECEGKFRSKKSKAVSKSGGVKYQWEIMQSYGFSDEQIAEFTDPCHWLEFFPPEAVKDLKAFGLGCDWRRTFITTDINPYFDSFVKWQMRKLKEMKKIVKELRYTIYSPLDDQPCADHDRASGEGVIPQEYTLIKMELVPPFPPKMSSTVLEGKKVYLAAATLRPAETITNCWMLPDGKYGAFEINETDVFILTKRAALNLAYQKLSRIPGKPTCLVELNGQDLIGLPLRFLSASDDDDVTDKGTGIVLPMLSVLTDKGTGIFTSDSPDDYMIADGFTGLKVGDRNKLFEKGQAVVYCEPEKKVVSRSGDECVVALTDQWYITYGEKEWKEAAEECLKGMNVYSVQTKHGFEHTLSWLNQWACSRNFGLGSRIPWDEQFLVEFLSDSTLYMAYYTVAHMLHLVKPEQLTDEVWDFVFLGGVYPESSKIEKSLLNKMKQEFEYWYPFDLRVSGKDLIQNHLTFCIYNHAAIMPKRHWPKGFRCNGHIMLNSEKMSKSTGNFRTIREAIHEFSADATRFSLADAGDGMDDANFVFETANAAILRLTKEISWMEKFLGPESNKLRDGQPTSYADRVFANEINLASYATEKNYGEYMFREALKTGFYDLQAARDEYRVSCGSLGMNRDLVMRFMDVQTRLICPICPHYAEYVWKRVLNKDGYVIRAGWPKTDPPDLTLKRANKYLQDSIVSMRKLLQKQILSSKKGKTATSKPTDGLIFVNEQYDGWKKYCLEILQNKFNPGNATFAPDEEIISELQRSEIGQSGNFKQVCMPFLRFKKGEVMDFGVDALDLKLPFSEIAVLAENLELIKRKFSLERLEVLSITDYDAIDRAGNHASILNSNPPSPGEPTAIFFFFKVDEIILHSFNLLLFSVFGDLDLIGS